MRFPKHVVIIVVEILAGLLYILNRVWLIPLMAEIVVFYEQIHASLPLKSLQKYPFFLLIYFLL